MNRRTANYQPTRPSLRSIGHYVDHPMCVGGTCGAPRVIAHWRGEREWVPVSNPAFEYAGPLTCARTDGVGVYSGHQGAATILSTRRCPLARPSGGSPQLVHRPCRRAPSPPSSYIDTWVRRTFSLWLFLSSPPASVSFRVSSIAFTVVPFTCCVNVNTTDATNGATPGATALLLDTARNETRSMRCVYSYEWEPSQLCVKRL